MTDIGSPQDQAAPDGASGPLAKMLQAEAPMAEPVAPVTYKVFATSKIAVSSAMGDLWKGRNSSGLTAQKPFRDNWEEAIKYYNNNQANHRVQRGNTDTSANTYYGRRKNTQWTETENVVYANIRAILPAIYAKNPQCEITDSDVRDEKTEKWADCVEHVVNTLANMQPAPGLNLKPKAKQAVVMSKLTNCGILEVGWTDKQNSSQQAIDDLTRLSTELAAAKDASEIKRIEGALMALDYSVNFLSPSGGFVRVRDPRSVVFDPDAGEPDFSDAKWMMLQDHIPTKFLNARFGEKDEDGQVKSIYEPSHILLGSTKDAVEEQVNNFKLFQKDVQPSQYGFTTDNQMKDAERTLCWWVWDKITRRVLLFAANNWKWPIWVWDDPYKLPRFFPVRVCVFDTPAVGAMAFGEVSYYLDQQDAINDINDEKARVRQNRRNVLFNSAAISRDDVEAWLKGSDGTARGVKLTEGQTLKDAILDVQSYAERHPDIFNKDDKFKAIDRIARVSDIMRGAQFKTNTTKDAVETYNSVAMMGIDAHIDVIEDFLGGVFHDVAFICCMKMNQAEVAQLIGDEDATEWKTFTDVDELTRKLARMQVVGGSSTKPTSQAKKQAAVQVGQVLGQFAKAAPQSSLMITLRMFENAFDEFEISSDDWELLEKEAQATISAQQQPQGEGAPQQGGAAPQQMQELLQRLAGAIDNLPPAAKQALGEIIAKGVPVMQALPQVIQHVQAAQPNPQNGAQSNVQPQQQPQQQQPAVH